jgi:hypothetical protein
MRNDSHAVLDEPVFELTRPRAHPVIRREAPPSPRLIAAPDPDPDPELDHDPTKPTFVAPASGRVVFLGLTMLVAVAGIVYSAVYLSVARAPSANAAPGVAEMQGR